MTRLEEIKDKFAEWQRYPAIGNRSLDDIAWLIAEVEQLRDLADALAFPQEVEA